jgi:hypothetical protein
MPVDKAADYHPYAACLMFKACRDSEGVQANLDAVVAHGYQLAVESAAPPTAGLSPASIKNTTPNFLGVGEVTVTR